LVRVQIEMDLSLITEKEAAELLRCSTRELRAAVDANECAVIWMRNGKRFFKRAFLREFQERRTTKAVPLG
jgi:hypothetical protein